MGVLEVIQATLNALELVEVRGKRNREALGAAVSNLEAILGAFKMGEGKENDGNDTDDQ